MSKIFGSVLLRLIGLFFFAASASTVLAQEYDPHYQYGVPPIDIDTYEIFDGRMIDLPAASSIDAAVLDEMQYVYAACELDARKFGATDCGCRAMNFLKHRLDMPEAHKQTVMNEAEAMHCLVPAKLEARYISDCSHSMAYKRAASKEAGDAYCACYAQTITPQVIALAAGPGYGNKLRAMEKKAQTGCSR